MAAKVMQKNIISPGLLLLSGIISRHTGDVTMPDRILRFVIYSVGADKLPGAELTGKDILYASVDLSGSLMTTLFATPALVTDSFFASYTMYDYAHECFTDTIGLLCGTDGNRPEADLINYGRNAVKIHHAGRDDFYSRTGLKTNLALFPILEFNVNGLEKYFIYNEILSFFILIPVLRDRN